MASKAQHVFSFLLFLFLSSEPTSGNAEEETWVKAGYWLSDASFPDTDEINSTLFTHLFFGFVGVDTSTFQLLEPVDSSSFSRFSSTVKRRNSQVKTLISIWNGDDIVSQLSAYEEQVDVPFLSSVVSEPSHRKSFIDSSIRTARLHGFDGLDLFWVWPNSTDLIGIGVLLDEWRAAITSEKRNPDQPPLILTMAVHYTPEIGSTNYPIESIRKNVDWANIIAYNYHLPFRENFTGFHSALYDPSSNISTDFGVTQWLNRGFPAEELVLGLPFSGYAWVLSSSQESFVGATASGPTQSETGLMGYKYVKSYMLEEGYEGVAAYNETYVANLFISGTDWINFDGVEAVRAKVLYAKKKGLLGYNVFHLGSDDTNWELSLAAQGASSGGNKGTTQGASNGGDKGAGQGERNGGNKHRLLLMVLLVFSVVTILTIPTLYCYRRRIIKPKGALQYCRSYILRTDGSKGNFGTDALHLRVYGLNDIKAATNNFSDAKKLGQGGYGPVYKGTLPMGLEIAVKRLSATSAQGFEEFQNEVTLTARLQHVNLVRVLGYCTEMEEKLLVYEYMPNKSLDRYIFDPMRRHMLDWRKRVQIIEGITQGLLYLQEYSNFTVIHRDLKASNVLLDNEMNPKISDFGMAKLFGKGVSEANTDRIVGTYGYIPPEYLRKGVYNVKYDVYSFGVLFLQIISGKRTTGSYGPNEDLNLFEYAFESWTNAKISDFADVSLDDSSSSCKISRCLQISLLCIQEDPKDRPSMLQVFSMLKNDSTQVPIPKLPAAFFLEGSRTFPNQASQQRMYSSYYSQVSEVEPR